jgi:hypothetical protein
LLIRDRLTRKKEKMMVYDNSGGDDYWVREQGFNMLNYFLLL